MRLYTVRTMRDGQVVDEKSGIRARDSWEAVLTAGYLGPKRALPGVGESVVFQDRDGDQFEVTETGYTWPTERLEKMGGY